MARRSKGHPQSVIRLGEFELNLDSRKLSASGLPVSLTKHEYAMAEMFFLRKGATLTKEMLLNQMFGGMDEPELKIVDRLVCRLRKKMAALTDGENLIETVWGRGYVLRDPGHTI